MPWVFREAFRIMKEGRPGPVLIDLPLDVQKGEIEYDPETDPQLPIFRTPPDPRQVSKAVDMLLAAEKPVMLLGGGVILADASAEFVKIAEILQIPVVTSYMGKSGIPWNHPLYAGNVGIQVNTRPGNQTFLDATLVLAVGARFNDRHTGAINVYKGNRKFIHIDVDPGQLGKNIMPDLGICADAKLTLQALLAEIQRRGIKPAPAKTEIAISPRADGAEDRLRQHPHQAAARVRGDQPVLRRRGRVRDLHRAEPDLVGAAPEDRQAEALPGLRRRGPAGLGHAGRHRREDRPPGQDGRPGGRRLRLPVLHGGAPRRRDRTTSRSSASCSTTATSGSSARRRNTTTTWTSRWSSITKPRRRGRTWPTPAWPSREAAPPRSRPGRRRGPVPLGKMGSGFDFVKFAEACGAAGERVTDPKEIRNALQTGGGIREALRRRNHHGAGHGLPDGRLHRRGEGIRIRDQRGAGDMTQLKARAVEVLKEFKGEAYAFGGGVLDTAPGKFAAEYGGKALFVGPVASAWFQPIRDRIVRSLENAGVRVLETVQSAAPNAPFEDVYRIHERVMAQKPDVLVVADGGSGIDAVKAAAVLATVGGEARTSTRSSASGR